jgi:hypothetical protein
MRRDEQEPAPFRWADRYDLVGVVAGVLAGVALLVAGTSVWLALALGFAVVNLLAFALRRRAGVAQTTLWQRARRRRQS